MLKVILITFGLSVATSAFAQSVLRLSEFATKDDTKTAISKMIKNYDLPAWVDLGGTGPEVKEVTIGNASWQVFSACKPHDCASESVAILWSEKTKTLAGVFSVIDEKKSQEKLTWMNISDELSIDGKTVLYAALTGSLDNHPDGFNFK
ncbi:Ivy family C-type lysozyme inhibitor [Citrobacter amalonaticus]|uniref:Ivy family C-type lysozyme inhibitor n=1 Tax=Citrobacter amalonaticus TaxID=35703 RepID=UPI001A2C9316|nr:C-lysozyme inhibitor [Citrobacter amalonaticus]HDQ2813306.1 Ivy family C-type lysozyme inhibitor [Citrobacter amalonaticus]